METYLLPALIGLGLAASSGLNTFLPLLMLSLAARYNILGGAALNSSFEWLSSDTALTGLAIASVVEVVADKVPAVDHLLDVVGTFARPIAGTVAAGSVFAGVDPSTAALLGLMIGAPSAFGVHAAKAGTRATSSATTFGIANPILSFVEDVLAVCLTFVALAAPFVVPIVLLAFVLVLWRLWKAARRGPKHPVLHTTPKPLG